MILSPEENARIYGRRKPRPAKPELPKRVESVLRRLQSKAPYRMPKPSATPVEIWLTDSDVRAIRRTLGIKSLRQYLKSKEIP